MNQGIPLVFLKRARLNKTRLKSKVSIIKPSLLKVALAQISPVWLNKEKTIEKIEKSILEAAKENCELIVFGEALLPGYPFWTSLTNAQNGILKSKKKFMHITFAIL